MVPFGVDEQVFLSRQKFGEKQLYGLNIVWRRLYDLIYEYQGTFLNNELKKFLFNRTIQTTKTVLLQ